MTAAEVASSAPEGGAAQGLMARSLKLREKGGVDPAPDADGVQQLLLLLCEEGRICWVVYGPSCELTARSRKKRARRATRGVEGEGVRAGVWIHAVVK